MERRAPAAALLPPLVEPAGNPYLKPLFDEARRLRDAVQRYSKGEDGYRAIADSWQFQGMGDRACVMAWAACHPASPLCGDPALVVQALRTLSGVFENHRGGDLTVGRQGGAGKPARDPNLNRFAFVPAFEAYLLLRETWPGLIPAAKRRQWEESVRQAAEFQLLTYGRQLDPRGAGSYPNMDVHYLLLMELASRILAEPSLRAAAKRHLPLVAASLYPDGAFCYTGRQNECFAYHEIDVSLLARYAQLTGSRAARDLVLATARYYPDNVEPGGVPESSTDPFWKHYWDGASPVGPDIVASMLSAHGGRAHRKLAAANRRVANVERQWPRATHYPAIYAATLWRELAEEPQADGYIAFDRNVLGPRGRFGRWSFSGTTRDPGAGAQGRDTFVGAMLTADATGRFPLDAALQVVTSEYRLEPGGPRWRTCRYLSTGEEDAVTVAPDLAALTTRYRIQNPAWGGKSTATGWEGQQEWLLTPHRLVGTLSLRPLADEQARSVHGRVRLGLKKVLSQPEPGTFRYGGLRVRLHEHNYADVLTVPSETCATDPPGRFRSTEIVLRDAHGASTGDTQVHTYPAGTEHFFTVEISPALQAPATRVKRHALPSGLRALEFTADGQWYAIVHNPHPVPMLADLPVTGRDGLRCHRASDAPSSAVPVTVRDGRVRCRVPPRSHIVLVAPRDVHAAHPTGP